jgi:serralysin
MKKELIPVAFLLTSLFSAAQPTVIQNTKRTKEVNPAVIQTIKTIPVRATYDFSNVKMCTDIVNNTGSLPVRNFSAVASLPKIKSDGSLDQTAVIRQPLAAETNKMWDPGQTITVYLSPNNGSDALRNKVRTYASEWETHANIKFQFVNDFKSAQIKVGFFKDNKFWSWVGKDVLFNPLSLYTMNFGAFDMVTNEAEIRGTIIHEFGHALGFIHEHQSPAASISWDKEKVYAYFADPPNKWTRGEVDFNIFNKYSRTSTNFSAYDKFSIMHYSFPAELTTNGFSIPANNDFSATDRQYARLIYPFPPTPSNATGTLRTGDDCDMVDFVVEYGVVAGDQVEFKMQFGRMDNKTVTWWKQIGIPKTNNTETMLAIQNHSLIQSENKTTASVQIPFNEINTNKGISFWKAKLLGIHTLLGFKWNVLPALKGGCRVTLTWKKDSCL